MARTKAEQLSPPENLFFRHSPFLAILSALGLSFGFSTSLAKQVRVLQFPENLSLGRLFYANAKELYPRKNFKKAQGKIEIGTDDRIGLEVSVDGVKSQEFWSSKGLQEVYLLDFTRGVVDDSFIAGMPPLPKVAMLRLEGSSNLTDKSLPVLAKLPALRMLHLQRTQIRGLNLSCFAKSPVTKLFIGNNTLERKTFDELSKLHSLTALGLDYAEFSWLKGKGSNASELDKQSAPHLAKLASLKQLDELTLSGLSVGPESLKVLSLLPKLLHLRIASTNVQGKDLLLIKNPALLRLNLSHCSRIDDSACSVIAKFKKLSYLNVSATAVSPRGLDAISKLNLRKLELVGVKLKGSDLKFLSKFRNLDTLELQNTGIGDGATKVLPNLTALKTLVVSDNHLSDASIASLAALKSLKVLDVTGTDISEKGFQNLKDSLPNCKVIWG